VLQYKAFTASMAVVAQAMALQRGFSNKINIWCNNIVP
jgi:hypothetical protein